MAESSSSSTASSFISEFFHKTGDFFAERLNATLLVSFGAVAVDIAYHVLQKRLRQEALVLHLQQGDQGRTERKACFSDVVSSSLLGYSSCSQTKVHTVETFDDRDKDDDDVDHTSSTSSISSSCVHISPAASAASKLPKQRSSSTAAGAENGACNNENDNVDICCDSNSKMPAAADLRHQINRCEESIRVMRQLSHRGVITLIMQNIGTGVTSLVREVAKCRPSTTYISLAGARTLDDVCVLLQRELNLEAEEKLPTTFFIASRLLRGLTGVLGTAEVTPDDEKNELAGDQEVSVRWARLTKVLEIAAEEAFHRNVAALNAKFQTVLLQKHERERMLNREKEAEHLIMKQQEHGRNNNNNNYNSNNDVDPQETKLSSLSDFIFVKGCRQKKQEPERQQQQEKERNPFHIDTSEVINQHDREYFPTQTFPRQHQPSSQTTSSAAVGHRRGKKSSISASPSTIKAEFDAPASLSFSPSSSSSSNELSQTNISFSSVPLIIFDDATELDEKAYAALATFAHNISSSGKFRVAFVVSSPYPFFGTRYSHTIKTLHVKPPSADAVANFIYSRCPFLKDEPVAMQLVARLTGRNLGIANMLCMKLEEMLCDSEVPIAAMEADDVVKTMWFSAIRQFAFATTRPLHLYTLQPVAEKELDEERLGIFRIAILLLEHEEDHEEHKRRRRQESSKLVVDAHTDDDEGNDEGKHQSTHTHEENQEKIADGNPGHSSDLIASTKKNNETKQSPLSTCVVSIDLASMMGKKSVTVCSAEEEEEISMQREALAFSSALDVCPLRVWLRLVETKRHYLPYFVSFDTVLFRAPLYRLAMIEVVGSRRESKTRTKALELLKLLEASIKNTD